MQGEAGVPEDASPGSCEVVARAHGVETSHWLPGKFCYNKSPSSQSYGFSSSHVWMGELDYKES